MSVGLRTLCAAALVVVLAVSCAATRRPESAPAASASDASSPGVPARSPALAEAGCPADSLRSLATARRFDIGIGGLIQSNRYMVRDSMASQTLRCAATVITNNGFYWSAVEPRQGSFSFAQADEISAWAQANGVAQRGHVLVWHNSLPAWLEHGSFTGDELRSILKTHIQAIVSRYRGKIRAWDVVNEAVDDRGNLRDTLWLRALGSDFIELSFRWAHEADPDALLFYNDYRNEGAGVVPERIYSLVRDLKARAVPIHGVGLQMHLIGGRETMYATNRPAALAEMAANLKRLGDLGLQVHVTEMDVSLVKLTEVDKLAQQAAIYGDIARTCVAAPRCTALVTWGLDDAHSWITGRYAGSDTDAPLLYDRGLRPKPAHDAIRAVLALR